MGRNQLYSHNERLDLKEELSSGLSGLAYYFGTLFTPISNEKFFNTSNSKNGRKEFLDNFNAFNVKFDQVDQRSIDLLKEILSSTTHKDLTYRINPISDSINFTDYI
jgi:hypothetical protein